MKAQLDYGGNRILLGDNAGGEAIMLHGVRVWISTGCLLCTYVVDRSHTQFGLAQNSTGTWPSGINFCFSRECLYGCIHICVL